MNIHRKGKSGCEISINHYTNVCPNSSFSIQILEKLPGNGYKNGARDKAIYQYRLERQDYWIKKLRTIYPYGLNDKTKSSSDDIPTGQQFPPLPRFSHRQTENRNRIKLPRQNPLKHISAFLEHINTFEPF